MPHICRGEQMWGGTLGPHDCSRCEFPFLDLDSELLALFATVILATQSQTEHNLSCNAGRLAMNTRNSPRWANLLFGLAAPLIVSAAIVYAYLRGLDFTETLGLLVSNLGIMFFAWLLFGLLLKGVVAGVRVIRGQQPSKVQIERGLMMAASFVFAALFIFVMRYHSRTDGSFLAWDLRLCFPVSYCFRCYGHGEQMRRPESAEQMSFSKRTTTKITNGSASEPSPTPTMSRYIAELHGFTSGGLMLKRLIVSK